MYQIRSIICRPGIHELHTRIVSFRDQEKLLNNQIQKILKQNIVCDQNML